jgi:tRNA(Leu) C34 or U34 (ribose-2'-O)-methylase TrmL
VFTVDAAYTRENSGGVDTSESLRNLPFYDFPTIADMVLPQSCKIVGVELTEDAIDLPSFTHPLQAVYILGPERNSLSLPMQEKCDFIIKIPVKFCLNVGMAGVITMYDRLLTRGKYAPRPVRVGGPTEGRPAHIQGKPRFRNAVNLQKYLRDDYRAPPPEDMHAPADD